MRLPLATTIQSRDGTLAKDSKLVNALVETLGDETTVLRRPGISQVVGTTDAIGRGVFCFDGEFYSVSGNTLGLVAPTLSAVESTGVYATSKTRRALAYFGNAFYAISTDGEVVKSTDDGATWSSSGTIPTGSFDMWFSAVASGSKIVVVGTNQFNNTFITAYSSDGVTWSLGTTLAELASDAFVVWTGVFFCAVCGTKAFKSTNGTTWTGSVIVAGTTWLRVANKGSYLVALSAGGIGDRIATSSDGVTWSNAAANPGLSKIACNGDVFCATKTTAGTVVATSSDGITWTDRSLGGTYQAGSGITSAKGGFVIAAFNSNQALISIDGIAWSTVALSSSSDWWQPTSKGLASNVVVFNAASAGTAVERLTLSTGAAISTTYALTGDTTTVPVSATKNGDAASTSYFMFKTTTKAYALSGTTLTQVTDVDFPAITVPGIAHLDGFFFVMKSNSQIYNSDLENPLSWNPLNFLAAEIEPDAAVALAKHQNYVVALKETTTELFYNAANASGSPLARLSNAAIQIGCGAGYSVVGLNGALFFISRTKSSGLSVHYFPAEGLQPVEIASPGVQRILNAADLTTVHSFAAKLGGHALYVINLVSAGITLAYDMQSQTWGQWTFLTAQSAKSVTALTQSNGVATATSTAHGYSDGDPVVIAGATPSGYNGTVNITRVDANTFTYSVSSGLATPATGTLTATGYDTGYFPFGFFASCGGVDYIQHEATGQIYKIGMAYADDNGTPIDVLIRTPKLDNGNGERKTMHSVQVVGEQITGNLLVRYTDDDYQTFSTYRQLSLAQEKAQLRRFGQFRRRAMDFRFTGSGKLRIQAIDADIEQGR